MPVIISIILIIICLAIILFVILKKFPALAILEVNNLPGEKEAKFKDQIIKARVDRDFDRWTGTIARGWLFLNGFFKRLLKNYYQKLKKAKANYKLDAAVSLPEKRKRIRELFFAADDLLKKGRDNEAEEKLLEIVGFDQKNLAAFFKLGAIYEKQKKWTEARQTYQYTLNLARQLARHGGLDGELTVQEIYFSLAEAEKEAGDLEAAYDNIQEALDREQNNPRYLDLILDLSIMKKDKDSAAVYLNKLAAANPENNKLAEWQEKIESLD